MTSADFDHDALTAALTLLPPGARVAFGAACAQRSRPSLTSRAMARGGRSDLAEQFDAALDLLWEIAARGLSSESKVEAERSLEWCMGVIPSDQDADYDAFVEDACSALAYALRCAISGEPAEAAWAAQCSYESLEYYVAHRDGGDQGRPESEERVLANPLVRAELARHWRDVAALRDFDPDHVGELRLRAIEDGKTLFT